MRGDGRIFQRKGSKRFWIAYYVDGQEVRESGGRTEGEARRLLRERLTQLHRDEYVPPEHERRTIGALLDELLAHLELKGSKSVGSLRSHCKPVRKALGHLEARQLTAARIEAYQGERLAAGKARATVNREIQPLQQALRLAQRQGRLGRSPYVALLREDNARQGFFEREDFERVARHLPDPIADIAWFAYFSGWRKGEIVGLRWESVDRKAKEVRLPSSKNGRGRVLPLEGALVALVERRWTAREFRTAEGITALSDFVFHARGHAVVDFKRSWATACRLAEVPGRLFHDLRRTAVRNMVRAGVPQSVAMEISGHRTISMFLRYNITSEADKREAMRRLTPTIRPARRRRSPEG